MDRVTLGRKSPSLLPALNKLIGVLKAVEIPPVTGIVERFSRNFTSPF
jgi:hypothetical protein